MTQGGRDWASRLGALVRLLWLVFLRLVFIGGWVLVVIGIGQFDRRLGTILGGLIVVGLMWPRSDGRK
jgi:hypothetical protein